MVNVRSLKSGLPMIIATIGITRLSTNDEMSAANARPMTKATASSTRLPRIRKSLNSLITVPPSGRMDAPVSATHIASWVATTISPRARRGPDSRRHAVPRGRLDRPGCVPVALRSSRRERLGRPGRDRNDGRGADPQRRRAAPALRGGARGGRRAGDRRRGHRHVLDRALDSPDRGGARARGRRLPRRDAVLQPAAAARDRGARRRRRGVHRPPGRLLRHPVAGRRRRRAGDDLPPRRDPERPRR